jgi:outer membrane receptor for ferrienterochelin and colicins
VRGSFSLRADHHSEYGTFLAPRISALIRFIDDASVRLTAGRGYYGPTPFIEETEEVGLSRLRPLNDLEAEVADLVSADLGWSGSGVETNVSLFASRIADALHVEEAGSDLVLVNLPGHTRTRGIDALVRYRVEPFGITTSYTFIDAERPDMTGAMNRVPLVPRHAASLVAVYEQHGTGRVGLEIYHTARQTLEDQTYGAASEPYTLVGLLVERRFGRVRAFLNMENLTNVRQTNFQPLLRPAATSYGRWSTDVWAPVDGRTFNGGIRLQLR